jgi:hypothetical protein
VKVKQYQASGERREDGGTDQSAHALSIAELGLYTRATKALLNAGIRTAENVLAALSVGSEALIGLKGFGIGR